MVRFITEGQSKLHKTYKNYTIKIESRLFSHLNIVPSFLIFWVKMENIQTICLKILVYSKVIFQKETKWTRLMKIRAAINLLLCLLIEQWLHKSLSQKQYNLWTRLVVRSAWQPFFTLMPSFSSALSSFWDTHFRMVGDTAYEIN